MDIRHFKENIKQVLASANYFWNEVFGSKENCCPRKYSKIWFDVQEQLQEVLRAMQTLLPDDQLEPESPLPFNIELVYEEIQATWTKILSFNTQNLVTVHQFLDWRDLHIETKELQRLLMEIYLIE